MVADAGPHWAAQNGPFFRVTDDVRHAREELERLLERAERTGDPELAAAIYHVATERGERGVADSYLETRPKEKRRWAEYVEAMTESQSLERLFATHSRKSSAPHGKGSEPVRLPTCGEERGTGGGRLG